jgi:hypothetical protein
MRISLVVALAISAFAQQAKVPENLTNEQMAEAMRENTAKFSQAAAELDRIISKMQVYEACRMHRRWYKFWQKRCRFE